MWADLIGSWRNAAMGCKPERGSLAGGVKPPLGSEIMTRLRSTTRRGTTMTRHRTLSTLLGTVALTTGLVIALAAPASARIVDGERYHEEFSGTNDNFCDTGMAVDFEVTIDGRFQVNSRGPGGPDYFLSKEDRRGRLDRPGDRTARHRHPAEHHRQGPEAHRQRRRHDHDHRPADRWQPPSSATPAN